MFSIRTGIMLDMWNTLKFTLEIHIRKYKKLSIIIFFFLLKIFLLQRKSNIENTFLNFMNFFLKLYGTILTNDKQIFCGVVLTFLKKKYFQIFHYGICMYMSYINMHFILHYCACQIAVIFIFIFMNLTHILCY